MLKVAKYVNIFGAQEVSILMTVKLHDAIGIKTTTMQSILYNNCYYFSTVYTSRKFIAGTTCDIGKKHE